MLVSAGELPGAEDGSGHQRRNETRGVVVVDRALRGRRREQVQPKLGERGDEHERCAREEEEEREAEVGEVVEPLRVEGGAHNPARVREDRCEDLPG